MASQPSPDGLLLTAGADHTLRLWDPEVDRPVEVLRPSMLAGGGPPPQIAHVALSADGRWIAAALHPEPGAQGSPEVIVIERGQDALRHLPLGAPVLAMTFTEGDDGPLLRVLLKGATGVDGYAIVDRAGLDWVGATTWQGAGAVDGALSPAGGGVVLDEDRDLRILPELGDARRLKVGALLSSEPSGPGRIALSPSGDRAALLGPSGRGGWILDLRARTPILSRLPETPTLALAFLGEELLCGLSLADGDSPTVTCLGPTSDLGPFELPRGMGEILIPHGAGRLAFGGASGGGSLDLRSASPILSRHQPLLPDLVSGYAELGFTAQGEALTLPPAAGRGRSGLFRLPTSAQPGALEVGPAGSLSAARGAPRLLSLPCTGGRIPLADPIPLGEGERCQIYAVDQLDGRSLFAGTSRGLRIYRRGDLDAPLTLISERPIDTGVHALALSPDGRTLAVGSGDGLVHLLDPHRPTAAALALAAFVGSGQPEWILYTEGEDPAVPPGLYARSEGALTSLGWRLPMDAGHLDAFVPGSVLAAAPEVEAYARRPDIVAWLLRQQDPPDPDFPPPSRLSEALPPEVSLERPVGGLIQTGEVQLSLVAKVRCLLPGTHAALAAARVGGVALGEAEVKEIGGGAQRGEDVLRVDLLRWDGRSEVELDLRCGGSLTTTARYRPREAAQTLETERTLHILSVGVSTYEALKAQPERQLAYADDDAEAFLAMMEAQRGLGLYRDVKVCGGGALMGLEAPTLEQQATQRNLHAGLRCLTEGVREGDVAVLFLAGHGVTEGDEYYFLATDSDPDLPLGTALNGATLRTYIRRVVERGGTMVVFLDTCYSGAESMAVGSRSLSRSSLSGADAATQRLLWALKGSVYTFSSSAGDQISQELDSKGHGAFTYALLQAMSGEVGHLAEVDGLLFTRELDTYLRATVPGLAERPQDPVLHMSEGAPDLPLIAYPRWGTGVQVGDLWLHAPARRSISAPSSLAPPGALVQRWQLTPPALKAGRGMMAGAALSGGLTALGYARYVAIPRDETEELRQSLGLPWVALPSGILLASAGTTLLARGYEASHPALEIASGVTALGSAAFSATALTLWRLGVTEEQTRLGRTLPVGDWNAYWAMVLGGISLGSGATNAVLAKVAHGRRGWPLARDGETGPEVRLSPGGVGVAWVF